MWFWLFVIIMVFGIGLIIVGNLEWDSKKHNFLWYYDESISVAGWIISVVSFFIAVIMLFVIVDAHTNVDAELEKHRETYNALVYKMESTTCRDEFGFLSKEVIDEVQEWNKNIRYCQSTQDNFWLGVFYPNVYDKFKTIDYESYNAG